MSYDEQRMQSCHEQPEPLPPIFRAKDKDGLWVYGSYHYSADGKEHYIIEQQKFIRGFDQRGEDDPDRVCMFSSEVHDIDPSTVELLPNAFNIIELISQWEDWKVEHGNYPEYRKKEQLMTDFVTFKLKKMNGNTHYK